MLKFLQIVIAIGLWNGSLTPRLAYGIEPAAIGRVNLTLAQYSAASKEMQTRDYRPASLSAYRVKGETLYAAMWQRSGQLAWKEELNRSQKEYEADAKALQEAEFRPVSLHVLVTEGQPRFTVVWKKLDGEFYYFRDHLSADTFRKFSDDYAQRDIYPTSICAVETKGQLSFMGIWEKTRAGSVEYQLGLSEAALAQKSKALQAKGFYPQFLSSYVSRGRPMWAVIWVQQEGVEVEAAPSLSEADWLKRSAELEKAGYDLMSLQGMALSGKPRFAAVWRKVKDLPEEPAANPKP